MDRRHETLNDDVDLASYLVKGDNLISVLVWYFGKDGFSYKKSGQAGLFIDCLLDDGKRIVSDDSLRAKLHPAYFTTEGPNPTTVCRSRMLALMHARTWRDGSR